MQRPIIASRRTRGAAALSLLPPTPAVRIPVRISSSPQGRDALLSMLEGGAKEVIVSSADGSLGIRAELALEDFGPEHSGGKRLMVDWSRCIACSPNGESVRLTRTELRLLSALLEGDGEPVSREHLVRCTWPCADLDRRSASGLQVYIYLLRRRLKNIGFGEALQTVRGVGYRLRL